MKILEKIKYKIKLFLFSFTFDHPFGKINWKKSILVNPEFSVELILFKYPIIRVELNCKEQYCFLEIFGFAVIYWWMNEEISITE